ncbi:HAD family hydrolase [Acetivibrio mesophilus]|uniref:HAD family hydrolase n=1 Tax=Acetivibrio mesophilus TaxID=2487273 RepID=A0A4Q0I5C0_9FIRM|nr:HAD-IA family hydrolase [Acetivibrio mesophilus]ODM25893.1 HAD family hydrolase [Clostridium sp. Bc-iso-3]RXE59523.1 HAD family hydrolase [Acetivibrio mesophilus]HHV29999.1 HAD-IA family hydrolase [Clostridium sp.]
MNNYKAVFFDFDYTLADSSKGVIECINYALQKMGYPKSSPESICRTIGLTLTDAYRQLSKDTSDSNAILFRQHFKERADVVMCDSTIIYNTVESVLKRLKSMNVKVGIVSTKYRYRIEDILKRDGLLQYFDIIIGGEDVVAHKPDPEGLLEAISRLECQKKDTLYVGDSTVDAKTAENAGVDFAAVLTGTTEWNEFLKYSSRAVIKDLSGLLDIFEE